LHSAVREIRQALHDDAVASRFVETVPRQGYRFVAPVEPVRERPRQRLRWRLAASLAGLALATAVVAWWSLASQEVPVPSAAVEATQRAYFVLEQRSGDSGHRAFELFERALRLDPEYVPALVGRARSRLWMSGGVGERWRAALAAAEPDMEQALALDPRCAAAWTLKARVRWLLHRDNEGAERAFGRALEIDRSQPRLLREWARFLASQQRHEEALQAIRELRERHPGEISPSMSAAWIYFYARRYEVAVAEGLSALELAPDDFGVHHLLATAFSALGDTDQANKHYTRMRELTTADSELPEDDDQWWLLGPDQGGPAIPEYSKALLVLARGDADRAYGFLERSVRTRESPSAMLAVDPRLDPLRSEPRFQALERQVVSAHSSG
jgi:tetratricopeptide (TPR) repeat protein